MHGHPSAPSKPSKPSSPLHSLEATGDPPPPSTYPLLELSVNQYL